MKKASYILLIGILLSLLACENTTEIKEVSDFFKDTNTPIDTKANINFELSDSTLVNDIEKQIDIDFCDDARFTAVMNYKNIDIEFPAVIEKNCGDKIWNLHNILPIEISENNQVLVYDFLVEENESIETKLIEVTKEMTVRFPARKNILYSFEWDKNSHPELIKKRVYETLKGIKNYSNEISLNKYNRELSDLTEKEIIALKKQFSGYIVIKDYFDPLPSIPPPPPKRNE